MTTGHDGMPSRGLHAADASATHRVRTSDTVLGFGIYGSYGSEIEAWRICMRLRRLGHSSAHVAEAGMSFLETFMAMDDRLVV